MATGCISGLTAENSRATGFVTRCMVAAFLLGQMEEGTKGSTSTIRNRGMESSHGLMVESTMAPG